MPVASFDGEREEGSRSSDQHDGNADVEIGPDPVTGQNRATVHQPEGEARALIFVSLILCDIALVLANRSFDTSLFAALGGSNRSLIAVIAAVMSVLAIALYVPVARDLFRFGWLSWIDLGIGLVAAIATLIALEAAKSLWRRRVPASA